MFGFFYPMQKELPFEVNLYHICSCTEYTEYTVHNWIPSMPYGMITPMVTTWPVSVTCVLLCFRWCAITPMVTTWPRAPVTAQCDCGAVRMDTLCASCMLTRPACMRLSSPRVESTWPLLVRISYVCVCVCVKPGLACSSADAGQDKPCVL